jgi:hypothetical protein
MGTMTSQQKSPPLFMAHLPVPGITAPLRLGGPWGAWVSSLCRFRTEAWRAKVTACPKVLA